MNFKFIVMSFVLVLGINHREQPRLNPHNVYHFKLHEKEVKVSDRQEFLKLVMTRQGQAVEGSFLETKNVQSARMHNYKNIQYTADLGIGAQYNTFKVVLDTGSANLWIDSDRCQEEGCLKHHQYKHGESQSFLHEGKELLVEFGSGDLKGEINSDTVFFGDLALPQQNIAEIVSENGAIFRDLDFDGILGLAYPQMAPKGFTPFLDNLIQSRKLDQNQFAFYFAKDATDITHSEFTLGGYNPVHVDGDIHYHDVIDQYYWMIGAENILVGGKDIGLCPQSGCRLIVDTGSSIMSGPIDNLGTLLRTLDVRDHCHEINKLPDIQFVIDSVEYTLTPEEYVKPTTLDVTSLSELDLTKDAQSLIEMNNWDCLAAFMPLDIQEPQGPAWILGDTFLRKYYSIFDRDSNRVGFAKSKQ